MPPLEDELRAALQGRAATLTPSADPLAGVEQRARGLRRRRTAASVAGSALAVLAVVGVVPLVATGGFPARGPAQVATSAPSPTPAGSPYVLDLDDPWEYRGDPEVLADGNLETWRRDWAARTQGAELVPLFGQVYEPSAQPELVFASRVRGTSRTVLGVATTSESGSRFLTVEREGQVSAVPVVVPGDEALRLLLVADPEIERLQYAADGSVYEDLAPLAPGVATVAVEQVPGAFDQYQVVGPGGLMVEQGPVADEPARDETEPAVPLAPANVQEWEPRGTVDGDDLVAARAAYAEERTVPLEQVQEKLLFAGRDGDRRYLLGQFWVAGDQQATTFGVVVDAEGRAARQVHPALEEDADVAVMRLPAAGPGAGVRLVIVPRPGTGQVLYSRTAEQRDEFAVDGDPALDGVVVLVREEAAERGEAADTVRLLDGDGRQIGVHAVPVLLGGSTSG